jgi:hypothetical protein
MQIMCKGHASKIIDKLIARRMEGLATPKQINLLRKYGIKAADWSFEQASAKIDSLSKGWRKKA